MPQLLLQPADLRAHLHPDLGVEIGQRLVEQQDVGVQHQRAGQRHPLLLAARELARIALLQPDQVHLPQAALAAAAAISAAASLRSRRP